MEERGIRMICKDFIRGGCNKDRCADIHDKALYPCPLMFGLGFCEKNNECEFSHEPLKSERDIEEFIIDHERFLIDIYKGRRETALGYYFIKYLHKLRETNRQRFDMLAIQLPHQMPPYISPRLLVPKNNFQHINAGFLAQQKRVQVHPQGPNIFHQGQQQLYGLQNQQNQQGDGFNLLNTLKKDGGAERMQYMGKFGMAFQPGMSELSNPLKINPPQHKMFMGQPSPRGSYLPGLLPGPFINQQQIHHGLQQGMQQERMMFGAQQHKQKISLIDDLKPSTKPPGGQSFLLNQLELQDSTNGMRSVFGATEAANSGNKQKKPSRQKIAKIFGKLKINKKKNNMEEEQSMLSEKLVSMRKMIFRATSEQS